MVDGFFFVFSFDRSLLGGGRSFFLSMIAERSFGGRLPLSRDFWPAAPTAMVGITRTINSNRFSLHTTRTEVTPQPAMAASDRSLSEDE
jgi:hypothetical protein